MKASTAKVHQKSHFVASLSHPDVRAISLNFHCYYYTFCLGTRST